MAARDRVTVKRILGMSLDEIESRLRAQSLSLRPVMLLIYAPVVIVFVVLVAIRLRTGIAIAEFTRDPLAFTGIPAYTGMLSNTGAVIWSGTAAICLFTFAISRSHQARDSGSRFLLAAGIITTLLLVDDLFMLHEVVFPENIGIPQNIVYAAQAAMLLWFLVWFRKTILQSDFLLLALAFVGFGISASADGTASINPYPGLYVFEDGGKLVGIVSWAAYFVLFSARSLAPNSNQHQLGSEHVHAATDGAMRVGQRASTSIQ